MNERGVNESLESTLSSRLVLTSVLVILSGPRPGRSRTPCRASSGVVVVLYKFCLEVLLVLL